MRRKNLLLGSVLTTALFSIFVPKVQAQTFDPQFHGVILTELQNDWVVESDDEETEVNTLSTSIEPYFVLSLMQGFTLEAGLVLEPVQDTDPGDDTYFENEGLYAEQLKAVYTGENFSVFGGKYNPSFGTAWDLAPGIYGADFAEDYETTEKIGVGGSFTLGSEETGTHTLTGNTFFADTSFLSDSTITRRGRLHKSDGGVSNTEDLSSFTLTLDSGDLFGAEGLNTNLGYRHQAEGDADTGLENETGYVVGANYTFALSDNVEATVLGEWAGIRNLDGTNNDVNYLTTSLGLTINENWNFAASYTGRDTNVDGGDDINDHMVQLSAGYAFENGITFDVGYRGSTESDVDTHILGGLVSYTYEF